jgi:hypothetical protein
MVDDELPLTGHLANASIQLLPSPPTTNGIGIQRYIKFKLDTAASNYNKWHNFFLFVLTKYDARDHVRQETSPHLATAEWRATDVDIVMWIYTTISDELRDVILTADITAYTAWQALKSFFIDNASGREIYLNKAFHGVKQGDMTVVAYCRKLKGIADVGAAVTDKKLTMRLIDGLDKRFKGQQEILEGDVPFPTFMQAQSRLQLAEQKIASHASEPPQICTSTTMAPPVSILTGISTPAAHRATWPGTANPVAAARSPIAVAASSMVAAVALRATHITPTAVVIRATAHTATIVAASMDETVAVGAGVAMLAAATTKAMQPVWLRKLASRKWRPSCVRRPSC